MPSSNVQPPERIVVAQEHVFGTLTTQIDERAAEVFAASEHHTVYEYELAGASSLTWAEQIDAVLPPIGFRRDALQRAMAVAAGVGVGTFEVEYSALRDALYAIGGV